MANQHNHHDDDDYIDEEAMMNFVSGVIVDPYEPSPVEEEGRPQDPPATTTHPVLPPVADVPPDVLLAELSDHVLQNAHDHRRQRPGKALAYEFQGQMEAGGQSSSSAAYGFDDHVQMQQQVQAATTTVPISIEDYLQQVPGESPSAFLDQVYGGEFHDVLQEIQGGQQGAPSYDHVQGLAAEEESCAYDSTDYDRMLHECWMACGGNPEETPALPGSGEDDEEQFFSSPSTDVDSPPFLDSFLLSGLSDVADALMRNEVNNAIGGDNCNNPQQAAAGFADDQFNFVPFVPGEVNCGNCHLVREIDHRSDSRVLRLLLHSAAPGTFEHAIIDRKHGGDDGEPPRSELLYINLRGRTQEWALGFMANLVEKLGNDTSGTLVEDKSFDPFHVEAASSSANPKPKTPKPKPKPKTPIPNPLHAQQLENGMLNMMLYPSDIHGAQQPATGDDDAANTIDDTPFYVTILESSLPLQPQAEQSGQNAAVHPSHAPIMGSSHAPQEEQSGQQVIITERLTMEEMKQYIKDQMEKARDELKVPSAVIRKFCRENASYTWMRIRIRKLNKKISKLAMSSQDSVKRSVIEEARKTINGYAVEKAHLKADIMRGMKKERGNNGCGSSRPVDNNNNEAGPSGT